MRQVCYHRQRPTRAADPGRSVAFTGLSVGTACPGEEPVGLPVASAIARAIAQGFRGALGVLATSRLPAEETPGLASKGLTRRETCVAAGDRRAKSFVPA